MASILVLSIFWFFRFLVMYDLDIIFISYSVAAVSIFQLPYIHYLYLAKLTTFIISFINHLCRNR